MEDWVRELENYLPQSLGDLKPGTVVRGKIVKILKDEAFVDIGFKGEISIPLEELKDERGELLFQEGDETEFLILKSDTSKRTYLSYKKLREITLRNVLKEKFRKNEPIKVKIKGMVRGGYEVRFEDIIVGFLPFSHAYHQKLGKDEDITGKEIEVEIIQFEKNNFVVSRRNFLERIFQQNKKALIEKIEKEGVLEGVIETRVKGGFILNFENVFKGFLPDKELSWSRIENPESFLTLGECVKVKVLEFDPVRESLKVSIKALSPDPWEQITYKEGDLVKGRVVKVFDFGAFVEIVPGVEGFIPRVEMGWSKNLNPTKILSPGDIVEGIVIYINPKEKRLTLSLRKLIPSPWDNFVEKVKVGDVIKGKVSRIIKNGIMVSLEDGIEGFIHISNISWERIDSLEERFKPGEEILAKVINLDPEKKKVELSIKHIGPDPWGEVLEKYKLGDIVEGIIEKIVKGGIIVKIMAGVFGFLPFKELFRDFKPDKTFKLDQKQILDFKVGERIKGKITYLDPENKKLHLSYLQYLEDLERQEIEKYQNKDKTGIKLGDFIKNKIKI